MEICISLLRHTLVSDRWSSTRSRRKIAWRQIQPKGSTTSLPACTPNATRDQDVDLLLLMYTPAPSPLQLRPASPAEREKEGPGEKEGGLRYCS
jgi:hypothetical protein